LKIAASNLPHLYLVPPLGVTSLEFCRDFWRQKTRVPGLLYGVVCVILGLAILVEHRLVTDGWKDKTNRRTDTITAYIELAYRCMVIISHAWVVTHHCWIKIAGMTNLMIQNYYTCLKIFFHLIGCPSTN